MGAKKGKKKLKTKKNQQCTFLEPLVQNKGQACKWKHFCNRTNVIGKQIFTWKMAYIGAETSLSKKKTCVKNWYI